MSFLSALRSPRDGLPPIMEDNSQADLHATGAPAIPQRAMNRPESTQFDLGDLPSRSFEYPPPAYSDTSTALEKSPVRIKDSKFVTERGGWRRLLVIIIALVIVTGLAVGLGVGLTRQHGSNHSKNPTLSTNPCGSTANVSFPVGTWSIKTALDQVGTNCTSNSLTWNCYPEITYAESSAASAATFNWIISQDPSDCSNYIVSTTKNPFTINFSNASLALVDKDMATERYTFQFTLQKQVIPASNISASNVATTCYYNTSTLSASLYTKRPQVYVTDISNSTTGTGPQLWPYAVDITQLSTQAPECFDSSGNEVGDFTSAPQVTDACECLYSNHDL